MFPLQVSRTLSLTLSRSQGGGGQGPGEYDEPGDLTTSLDWRQWEVKIDYWTSVSVTLVT